MLSLNFPHTNLEFYPGDDQSRVCLSYHGLAVALLHHLCGSIHAGSNIWREQQVCNTCEFNKRLKRSSLLLLLLDAPPSHLPLHNCTPNVRFILFSTDHSAARLRAHENSMRMITKVFFFLKKKKETQAMRCKLKWDRAQPRKQASDISQPRFFLFEGSVRRIRRCDPSMGTCKDGDHA